MSGGPVFCKSKCCAFGSALWLCKDDSILFAKICCSRSDKNLSCAAWLVYLIKQGQTRVYNKLGIKGYVALIGFETSVLLVCTKDGVQPCLICKGYSLAGGTPGNAFQA